MFKFLYSRKVTIWIALALGLAIVTWAIGCTGKSKTKVDPPRTVVVMTIGYEVGADETIVAQAVAPVEIMADVYVAGHIKPKREKVRILPGCWLVPRPVVTMPGNPAGPGVICDEDADYCEVIQ